MAMSEIERLRSVVNDVSIIVGAGKRDHALPGYAANAIRTLVGEEILTEEIDDGERQERLDRIEADLRFLRVSLGGSNETSAERQERLDVQP